MLSSGSATRGLGSTPQILQTEPLLVAPMSADQLKRHIKRPQLHKADSSTKALALHNTAQTMLHQHHNYEGALHALNRAINLQPQSPSLFEDRGLIFRKLNRWADAIADYNQARTLEERHLDLYNIRPRSAAGRVPPSHAMARSPSGGSSCGGGGATSGKQPSQQQQQQQQQQQLLLHDQQHDQHYDQQQQSRPPPPPQPTLAASAATATLGSTAAAAAANAGLDDAEALALLNGGKELPPAEVRSPAFEEEAGEEAGATAALLQPRAEEPKLGELSESALDVLLAIASAPPEERSDGEIAALSNTMRCVPVLASLPEEARLRLCAGATYEQYEDEQVVASIEDIGGGTDMESSEVVAERGLCVVLFGELRVVRRSLNGGTAAPGGVLKAGEHFGENALLHKAFRHTTLRATERSGLLVISDGEFRLALRRNDIEQVAEKAIFVASVAMFAKLPWDRLLRMVHLLQPKEAEAGEILLAQGDTPQGLYVVRDGRCVVVREMEFLEHGRRRTRRMHLETLMPRDTYGGDAVLHGLLRSRTTLIAETDSSILFMPRMDFSPSHLTEEALRMLKLNAKLYRPDDELLLQRHYHELEWDRAKRHFIKDVLKEGRDRRALKNMLSRNPATMKRGDM